MTTPASDAPNPEVLRRLAAHARREVDAMGAQVGSPRAQMAAGLEWLAGLRIQWVVRQQVRTARKSWLVDVSESDIERVARQDYERLVAENPNDYFELVAVMHTETCQAFTPHKG